MVKKTKDDDKVIDILSKQKVIKQKLYVKRRIPHGGKITLAARTLAKACAEDANTAYYIKEYIAGNHSARDDYIEYMADKFQFMMNGGKL